MDAFRYITLANDLEARIQDQTYEENERLPSVRALREKTGLSVSTICRALEELERRGRVEARPRSGYYVLVTESVFGIPRAPTLPQKARAATPHELAEDIVRGTGDDHMVPLGGAALSSELCPLKHLSRIGKDLLNQDPTVLTRYVDPSGHKELRRQIAKRPTSVRANHFLDNIVITHGCLDAVRLSVLATTRPGDVVAIEAPTFFGFLQLLRDLGLRVVELPVRPDDGVDIDHLEKLMKNGHIRTAILTPNFHNPTGALMRDEDKQRIAKLAARHRTPIIESDVYADLHFGKGRPQPISHFDPQGWVLYCSSFSKSLCAGLRVGWASPGRFETQVKRLALSGSVCGPAFNQLVVAQFLQSGAYDRHLRRLRTLLASQVAATRRHLRRSLPKSARVTDPKGGLVLWVQVSNMDSERVFQEAQARHIAFLPGIACAVTRKFRDCLRLSCGHPLTPTIKQALTTLGTLIEKNHARRIYQAGGG